MAVLALTGWAQAAGFVIADAPSARNQTYPLPQTDFSDQSDRGGMRLTEKPVGELIAARLGLANGRAELFRFRVENAPSDKTMLDGVFDGGGIKLKLTW